MDSIQKLFWMQATLEALAQRIKELRAKRKISQEEFANLCGLDRSGLGRVEQARSIPRLDTLLTISKGFGMTVSEFLKDLEKNAKK